MVLLVWSFRSELLLVLSAANPIRRDPAHTPLSTPVSDDISKAHADLQRLKWIHKLQIWRNVKSALTFYHEIYVHEAHQEFSPSCHLAEEVEFSLKLAICLFCLILTKRSSIDLGILYFSKIFEILLVIQQNPTLMWHYSHKRYVLQDLTVSAHHRVIAWTSWYQQRFYWNWNRSARGGEVTDCSATEEELGDQCLLQEVPLDRCLRQLGHWIQYPRLHLHLNALR